jgi:ketosteroid isomerase-like protein
MLDPISPPAARRPEETVELVSAALSDGDLEAVLAQYERGAVLQPWAAGAGHYGGSLRETIADLMALRLPLSATVHAVLASGDLALVLGEREIVGTGPASERIRLSGLGSSVVRRLREGSWCIVAEAWCLGEPGPGGPHSGPPRFPPAPGEPPRADGESVLSDSSTAKRPGSTARAGRSERT